MDDHIQLTSSLKSNQMSYHDIDYDDDAEEESETTLQSAKEELEYWTEFFQEQKDENVPLTPKITEEKWKPAQKKKKVADYLEKQEKNHEVAKKLFKG